jgi:hypothetical protein
MLSRSIFHPLEGGQSFLNILLKVLDKNGPFFFQQEIESISRAIDFQKAVDD